jgi:hypothetical protein
VALVDVVLGVVVSAIDTLRRGMGSSAGSRPIIVNAGLEIAWKGWSVGTQVTNAVGQAAAPVTRVIIDPPLVPRSLRIGEILRTASRSWQQRQPTAVAAATQVRDFVVPVIVDNVVSSVDLTTLVLREVDLGQVVTAALDQLDLTEIVVNRVDLDRVTKAVLDRIDLDAVARERMDLLGMAEYIVAGIDLPEIIRESTGSVASETVRTMRMQSIDADDAVQRVVDRVLLWRKGRSVREAEPDS